MDLFKAKFRNAFHGVKFAFYDTGVRIQLVLMAGTLIFFCFLSLSLLEWMIVVLCCGLVVVCEIINYCIECIMNYLQPLHDPRVGKIKDIAAGFVLVSCLIASVVAVLMIVSKIG